MKKVVIGVFIFICIFFSMDKVLAGRGCCSHHGGQAYCSSGRWVCKDGTYSPTCTCSGGAASGGNSSYRRSVTTTAKKVYGCTNSSAINYNSYANVSDGSCRFEKTETSTETIEYETITNGDKTNGRKEVVASGKTGEKKILKKIITDEAGHEVSSEVVKEEVTKEPVNEVIEYKEVKTTTTNKSISDKKDTDESSNKTIIFEIILIIISAIYSSKNKDANTIINKIKKTKSWLKVVLYFLYFIFVIPPFIDIVLIIISEIKKAKK